MVAPFFSSACVRGLDLESEPEMNKILAEKNLGQSAHADAADTDKMYMKWFVKIYLIHSMFSLINYLQIFINPVTVTYSHSYWNCFICLFIILPVP